MAESFSQLDRRINEINGVSIRLASPDTIRNWSYGEVTKPETINYRSFKPERDGLFCEKIFGPVRNWECNCGKYKRIRYRGVVCDRCGVEVTHSKVRRERMGHIELAVPIIHIWFLKSVPSHVSYLLGLTNSVLERIVYYESYVVIDPGNTSLKRGMLLSEDEFIDLEEQDKQFVAKMGGEAVLEMLATLDLEELSIDLRSKIKLESSEQRRQEHLKRLRIVEAFLRSKNNPENMILRVLPVLPPDLRPLVPLEGGRFATSDLNDLYRRVINRNNRLKKLIEIKAPEVILRNEMRMLQEAVDTLFDNGRRTFSVKGEGKRPLKSLSDLLKGKQGRFRQNLLGKRVDYSGRSVIVVGPELKIHQCGLPKMMALELFKPFVIQKLEEKGFVQTVKSAKKFVEKERPEVWDILEEVIKDHPVLLNRAPTLHRLGIQAFFPVLVEGKAIRLHPLVCSAFNADFDGDQMAVHVPLSFESQLECRFLMLSANNLLSPASGQPVMTPTQDIVLGIYYLTKLALDRKGQGRGFSSPEEVIHALTDKQVDIHAKIKLRLDGKIVDTTPGRVIFNSILPEGMDFVNELMNKKRAQALINEVFRKSGTKTTCKFLDDLKDMGYEYATRAGITFGADDLIVPDEKERIIEKSIEEVNRIRKQYDRGIITEGERYNKLIDLWTHTTNDVADKMHERLSGDKDGFNSVYIMMDSQARGSKDQIKQLAGMRGLMQKPQKKITGAVGEIIENPIISNFKDGLTVLEYFISTHGARKGLADTALKTADAGYLTRRLVDVVQDVVIYEIDCGTSKGIEIEALSEGDEVMESLATRIVGRTTQEDVYDPVTEELICPSNTLIDDELALKIESVGVESVQIKSVLTCDSIRGVCQSCYGRNLATGKVVDVGEAVGIMAAQSIGEPGTQLTLRTFHIGGTASRLIAQSKEIAKIEGSVSLLNVEVAEHKDGTVVMNRTGELVVLDSQERERYRYNIPYGSFMNVSDGENVTKGMELFSWDPYNNVIMAPKKGTVKYSDLIDGDTLREIYDERSGITNTVVVEHRERKLHPHVQVFDDEGNRVANIAVPSGCFLQVKDGQVVVPGDIVAKIPRESSKSRDITGGLPRVAELFEARRPKDAAIISEIDGFVSFGDIERGGRKITVRDEGGEAKDYLIPLGKHLRVHENDRIKAGDRLSEGSIDPHDILRIMGENAVQQYLLDEIQAVYRLQGVTINDKHVEVIVAQMLRKVRVEKSGDTEFLEGDDVDRKRLREANEAVLAEGGEPATFKPMLLGITKASLTTESFLSAASFQETTKVLSRAAVEGKTDRLSGLKENLIMGNLIPAGTGTKMYRSLKVKDLESEVLPVDDQQRSDDFVEIGGEL
ncbi:DNA-directed RNA polymerase subunit beta' [Chitinispirillales bacterium ANBcel5]|uniref:DNA-directed RNA polymerase subunit beta' n=1 Tax=Cellulosispirillum alkaliphilum TaxID=3039283 RepID=UPI002A52772F|nr:DNA-directed RNA polymerase subunit beta' [Chitinispirillales bacterium ANBcel5]